VAGVELQACPERADLGPVGSDLPQQPRLGQRAIAREEAIVERPDPLGEGAIEVTDLVDRGLADPLTLVRDLGDVQPSTRRDKTMSWLRPSKRSSRVAPASGPSKT
jgi:hypothetical protein